MLVTYVYIHRRVRAVCDLYIVMPRGLSHGSTTIFGASTSALVIYHPRSMSEMLLLNINSGFSYICCFAICSPAACSGIITGCGLALRAGSQGRPGHWPVSLDIQSFN